MISYPAMTLIALAAHAFGAAPASRPSVQEAIAAPRDVWGEAAMREPNGASYEFFADLLPPLRYVNTAFWHYPIVLSSSRSLKKARLVSSGSAINARADSKPMWHELGTPITFIVGEPGEPFGTDLKRLDGPRYADGFLPIVQLTYQHGGVNYSQEVFAEDPAIDALGTLFVHFRARGVVTARIAHDGTLAVKDDEIRDERGQTLVMFDTSHWRWLPEEKSLKTTTSEADATLVIFTVPAAKRQLDIVTPVVYERYRLKCMEHWNQLLGGGMKLEVPEARVNHAWKSLVIGNFMIAQGDRMCYSAGNAYDHLYEGECGDATRALLLYGYLDDGRNMVEPLLKFQRQATRFHVAGFKLQLLSHYYWLTRDAEMVRNTRRAWIQAVDAIRVSRERKTGLLPRENYCGDIPQQVYTLNSNANAWRGLRDMSVVLDEIGEKEEADKLAETARQFRKAIIAAVEKSEYRDTEPPFIPNALFGDEKPYETLTSTRLGSYYDLMAPYIIGSDVFGPGSPREQWMLDYLLQHGGIAMGMIRCQPATGQFAGEPGVNDLYGLRFTLAQLRRDEREQALVTFYGKLAQGMTRETFIGGEGTRFLHGDIHGRSMYLPPNSAANAMFLWTLRYLLIQDWDADDDGRPDTLRLLFAAPRRWFADGAVINIENAPTQFGRMSLYSNSHLNDGHVDVDVIMPERLPAHTSLRVPLPIEWQVDSATANGVDLPVIKDGAVNLAGQGAKYSVRFAVRATRALE